MRACEISRPLCACSYLVLFVHTLQCVLLKSRDDSHVEKVQFVMASRRPNLDSNAPTAESVRTLDGAAGVYLKVEQN